MPLLRRIRNRWLGPTGSRLGATLLLPALGIFAPLACGAHHDDGPALASRDALLTPETCQPCHRAHYDEWAGSMHAYAASDPVFLAMNKRGQRETNGKLGDFCVKCHAPMAVREGATTDGLNLDTVPAKLKGVTCFFCHTVDAVTGTHDAALHLSDDLTMRGAIGDPVANTTHKAKYSVLHDGNKVESSALCGTCHDIVTPGNAAIERTYQEWQTSLFSHVSNGAPCRQCHMHEIPHVPIAQAPNAQLRNRHVHSFVGVDTALGPPVPGDESKKAVQDFLGVTVQAALCVTQGSPRQIRVILDNAGAGHSWPSGASQDRRAWVEVKAYAGQKPDPVYQSGAVADGASLFASPDPDLWLLRDCMFDGAGREVHMFWEAVSTEGYALPAPTTLSPVDPKYTRTHILQRYPRRASGPTLPQTMDRVTLRVRLQPIGVDVLDDLVQSGDLDPAVRQQMPVYDVQTLEWTQATPATPPASDGARWSCVVGGNFDPTLPTDSPAELTRCKP